MSYSGKWIWLQYASHWLPNAIDHSHMCVCVSARVRVCKVGQGVWVARLTLVEWHINDCTACNLQYKAQALVWCPFILISLHPHFPASDNISSAAELLGMHACHIASGFNINDTVFSPISMDIQIRGVCSTYREKGEGHTRFWWGKRCYLEDLGVVGRIILK